MKNYLILLLIHVICINLGAKNKTDSIVGELKIILDQKAEYVQEKENKLESLKKLLHIKDLSIEQEYDINYKLYQEYNKYQLDSAIHYVQRNLTISNLLSRKDYQDASFLELAGLYSRTGRYIESEKILLSVSKKDLPKNLLPLYYETFSLFYAHYAQSNNVHQYFAKNELYRDSLLMVMGDNTVHSQIIHAEKNLYGGQLDIVENRLLNLLKSVEKDTPDYGIITYMLGLLYNRKHNKELEEKYYSMSVITDVKNATKDNASQQNLALAYYDSGKNINMAYRLTESAIEDAVFCNVRFRTIEISEFYSIINNAYLTKEQKQKKELQFYLFCISILSLFLILTVVYIYKQVKRLSKIRKELYRTNVQLKELNDKMSNTNQQLHEVNFQLSESDNIKQEYIAQFFDMCSSYINKLEDYRKALNKKAANSQLDDLYKQLKSTTLIDNELEELYKNFDRIFIGLYPNFVQEFNELLIKEEQIILKPGELLNTELRIFALIRLGITDSVKIAAFLRYSLSTIYNYRTKARNKAAVSRDEFEKMIIKIGTLQDKN